MENKISAPFSNFLAWFWSICNNELSLDLVDRYLGSLNKPLPWSFCFLSDTRLEREWTNIFSKSCFQKINKLCSGVSRENNFQWFILNSHSESIYSSIDFWNVTYYRVKVRWWEPKWISGMDKSLFLINPLFCQLSACLYKTFFSGHENW